MVGIGKYTGELAEWLIRQGHEVHVICAPSYFPEWSIKDPSKNKYSTEERNGIKIYRAPIWIPTNPVGINRIIHLLSFATSSIYQLIRQYTWKPHYIITTAPAILCAPATILFSWICGKKCISIIHIQDYEIDAAYELGLLKGKIIRNLANKIESKIINSFDYASSISKKMVEQLHRKGIEKDKTFMLPNWVDVEKIYPIKEKLSTKYMGKYKQLKEEGKIIVMYSGSMNQKQDFQTLIKSIKYLTKQNNIIWIIAGNGPSKKEIIRETVGLSNVMILPLQPEENMNEWLNLADIHLVPQKGGTSDLVLPSKMLGIFASGKAIVAMAPDKSELYKIVNKVGICTKPGESKAFAKAINHLVENPEIRNSYGRRARKMAEERYGKEKVLGELERKLYEIKSYDKRDVYL